MVVAAFAHTAPSPPGPKSPVQRGSEVRSSAERFRNHVSGLLRRRSPSAARRTSPRLGSPADGSKQPVFPDEHGSGSIGVGQHGPSQTDTLVTTQQADTSDSEISIQVGDKDTTWIEQILGVLFAVLFLLPILVLLLGIVVGVPTGLLAVCLVMDSGCLRAALFIVGWGIALLSGTITGGILALILEGVGLGSETIGEAMLSNVFGAGPFLFFFGYPVAAVFGKRWFDSMSRERFLTWKQTLTGGAMLGFGVGSVAHLLRSVFALKGGSFGGFGGGSFGGGGASGSFQGTAVGASSSAAGGASGAAAGSAGVAPGVAGTGGAATASSGTSTSVRTYLTRAKDWLLRFQWYHVLAFLLITLIFVPLGLGTVEILQNTEVLVSVLLFGAGYLAYRTWNPDAISKWSSALQDAGFQGGEASGSWR